MSAPVESALQDARIEVVEETTHGVPPSDPSWEVLTDYLKELSVSPEANRDGQSVVGSGDLKSHFRGPEEHTFTTDYYKQQAFVDSSGNANYPAAQPLVYDYQSDYPSYTLEYRRTVGSGGNDGAGFREYLVAFGARPTETSVPGDPSESEPITESLSWDAEKTRAYVIHQPSSSTTLDVTNDGSTSVDVTIEDEGASTTETVTVSAGSTTTTTESFADVDAIWCESEPDGDISVTDGSGTDILDQDLAGSETDGVEGERGIPALGAGSHGTSIGVDPSKYLFLGVDTVNWQGSALADRIHALDLTVGVETDKNAQAGTRRQSIDIGTRTAEIEAETAGPYESAKRIRDQFRNEQGDFVYKFPDNDVALKNASLTDAPDYTRSAGETNYIPSTTFQGAEEADSAAIVVTNTA